MSFIQATNSAARKRDWSLNHGGIEADIAVLLFPREGVTRTVQKRNVCILVKSNSEASGCEEPGRKNRDEGACSLAPLVSALQPSTPLPVPRFAHFLSLPARGAA